MTREQKYKAFRALHERPGAFVIPNPWNAGTARILAALGFEALATTSAGYAFAVGRRDSAAGLIDVLFRQAGATGAALVIATHDDAVAQRLPLRWTMTERILQTGTPCTL